MKSSCVFFPQVRIYAFLFGKSCFQCFFFAFVTRLAEQSKHVLLIAFNARLVERVHAEEIAGDGAGLLEEVDDLAEGILGEIGSGDHNVRHAAVVVCSTVPSNALRLIYAMLLPSRKLRPSTFAGSLPMTTSRFGFSNSITVSKRLRLPS